MKKLMILLLAFTAFSFQLKAQPTDDGPGDPGANTYGNGYSSGAAEAAYLKESLADVYGGTVDSYEWHFYDETYSGGLGALYDYSSYGYTLPKLIWSVAPSSGMTQDAAGTSRVSELALYQYDDDFSAGYYQGFLDHWYNSY